MATAPGITQWIPLPYGYLKEFLRDPLSAFRTFIQNARKVDARQVSVHTDVIAAEFTAADHGHAHLSP